MTADSWGETTILRDLWAQAERRRKRRKMLRMATSVASLLLLTGLVWWFQSSPIFSGIEPPRWAR